MSGGTEEWEEDWDEDETVEDVLEDLRAKITKQADLKGPKVHTRNSTMI